MNSVREHLPSTLMRPGNRGVLILPGPLQALVGAIALAFTVPAVAYMFMQSRWPTITFLYIGIGVFVVYLAAFAVGLIKPYKP
jgi:hypothetical protein